MINYETGGIITLAQQNAKKGVQSYIIHGCNCQATMGKGHPVSISIGVSK